MGASGTGWSCVTRISLQTRETRDSGEAHWARDTNRTYGTDWSCSTDWSRRALAPFGSLCASHSRRSTVSLLTLGSCWTSVSIVTIITVITFFAGGTRDTAV